MHHAEPATAVGDTRSVAQLQARYGHLSGTDLLRPVIAGRVAGSVALTSSFGAESAVLLHMAASVDPDVPVIFLDTGKLFAETIDHHEELVIRFGLTDVRTRQPSLPELRGRDGDGTLHRTDPDACCALRKTAPLNRALKGFDAWISGRKRFQGGARTEVPAFEAQDGRIKINPLARFSPRDIEDYRRAHDLPAHPLVADGYLSIGCQPCTSPVRPGEDARAGRWRGRDKTECGIHFTANGTRVRVERGAD